jgi:hypothetical protein
LHHSIHFIKLFTNSTCPTSNAILNITSDEPCHMERLFCAHTVVVWGTKSWKSVIYDCKFGFPSQILENKGSVIQELNIMRKVQLISYESEYWNTSFEHTYHFPEPGFILSSIYNKLEYNIFNNYIYNVFI